LKKLNYNDILILLGRCNSMAKRGRPSKKTLKKRKQMKRQSNCLLIIAVGSLILFIALAYFLITKQGI